MKTKDETSERIREVAQLGSTQHSSMDPSRIHHNRVKRLLDSLVSSS